MLCMLFFFKVLIKFFNFIVGICYLFFNVCKIFFDVIYFGGVGFIEVCFLLMKFFVLLFDLF